MVESRTIFRGIWTHKPRRAKDRKQGQLFMSHVLSTPRDITQFQILSRKSNLIVNRTDTELNQSNNAHLILLSCLCVCVSLCVWILRVLIPNIGLLRSQCHFSTLQTKMPSFSCRVSRMIHLMVTFKPSIYLATSEPARLTLIRVDQLTMTKSLPLSVTDSITPSTLLNHYIF
jgi:hypothetical protein